MVWTAKGGSFMGTLTCVISVAKEGQGLFVLTRSVGTSSTFVGTLSLSVADSVCV